MGASPPDRMARAPGGQMLQPFIVFAFLCVGPLALPLLWWCPHTARGWKIGLTVATLALSWLMLQATLESIRVLKECYGLFEGL